MSYLKKYVVLYDTWFTRDCSHVSIFADAMPSMDEAYAAVAKARKEELRQGMRGVKVTRMIELRDGERYKIPLGRIWPFTSKLFDKTFAREFEEASGFVYEAKYDPEQKKELA